MTFTEIELEQLLTELRAADPGVTVTLDPRSERGYGVSPWEVIEIVATAGGAAAAVQLSVTSVRAAVAWARKRWTKDKEAHPHLPPRPRSIRVIYGPDGSVLKVVSIDLPEGEPQERSEREAAERFTDKRASSRRDSS
jgi:hypothetical protein